MEDRGDPLRRPWPSSAPPLLLRAGVLGPPLPLLQLLALPGLMLRPRRAKALASRRSLQSRDTFRPLDSRHACCCRDGWRWQE